jgi:hypothetical protein
MDLDQEVFMGLKLSQVVGVGLLVFSVKKYIEHKGSETKHFKPRGGYEKITPFKHDVIKTLTVEILPILLFSTNASSLMDITTPLESIYGKVVVTYISFLTFYHFIEPYFANKFSKF